MTISEFLLVLGTLSRTNPILTTLFLGRECPSDRDHGDTLTDATPLVLQSQSPERATAVTSNRVQDVCTRNQVAHSVENVAEEHD